MNWQDNPNAFHSSHHQPADVQPAADINKGRIRLLRLFGVCMFFFGALFLPSHEEESWAGTLSRLPSSHAPRRPALALSAGLARGISVSLLHLAADVRQITARKAEKNKKKQKPSPNTETFSLSFSFFSKHMILLFPHAAALAHLPHESEGEKKREHYRYYYRAVSQPLGLKCLF